MAGETKWTPGPWEAEPMTGRGAWVRGKTGEWSALSCGDTDARAEANARLIAASPCLAAFVQKHADNGDAEALALMERVHASR